MLQGLLAGKTAVITGAGRGIGAAAAQRMAEAGANLVLSDLDPQPLEAVARPLSGAGIGVATLVGDVTAVDFAPELLRLAEQAFGTPDILLNNAGYTWDAIFHKLSAQQWQAMLDVHLTAPQRMMQVIGGAMRDAAKRQLSDGQHPPCRKIINVSSISGTEGNPGQANYSAAKAGVIGLTKTVAKEWGRFNICVNAVAFGWIDTRLTRDRAQQETIERGGHAIALGIPAANLEQAAQQVALGRAGTPHEAAGAILFLASPLSDYVSAQVLVVDGGR